MTGFWVFLTVLVICVAVVSCFYISNSTYPNAKWLERRLDEIDRELRQIIKMRKELLDQKIGSE